MTTTLESALGKVALAESFPMRPNRGSTGLGFLPTRIGQGLGVLGSGGVTCG
jgi:hypothetical protein